MTFKEYLDHGRSFLEFSAHDLFRLSISPDAGFVAWHQYKKHGKDKLEAMIKAQRDYHDCTPSTDEEDLEQGLVEEKISDSEKERTNDLPDMVNYLFDMTLLLTAPK